MELSIVDADYKTWVLGKEHINGNRLIQYHQPLQFLENLADCTQDFKFSKRIGSDSMAGEVFEYIYPQ